MIGDPVPRHRLFNTGKRAMRRGDQYSAIWRDKAAHDRPTCLHPFCGNHDIDIGLGRAKGKDGLAACICQHFYVIDRRPGALGNAGDRGCLDGIAVGFCQIDNPVCQHTAALPADRHDRQLDDIVEFCFRLVRHGYAAGSN